VPWYIAEEAKRGEVIDASEAIKRYNAARKCSRVELDIPFAHEKGKVYGRLYYRPGYLRNMPRMFRHQFLANCQAEEGSRHAILFQKAIDCGDVLKLEIGEDPISGETMFAYVGADTHQAVLDQAGREKREEEERKEQQRKAEAQKRNEELERKAQKIANTQAPFLEALKRPGSKMAQHIRDSGPIGDIYQFMKDKVMGFYAKDGREDYHAICDLSYDAIVGLFHSISDGMHARFSEEHDDYVGLNWLEKQKTPPNKRQGLA